MKLQALVRGFLVRKQATATLYSMQALIRAQATVRAHKSSGLIRKDSERFQSLFRARKSIVSVNFSVFVLLYRYSSLQVI